MAAVLNKVKSLVHDTVSLVYMDLCIGCYKADPIVSGNFCLSCAAQMSYFTDQAHVTSTMIGKVAIPADINNIYSLFSYNKSGLPRKILHNLKYGGRPDIGVKLGEQLGNQIDIDKIKGSILVPVPLHPRRLKKRGYNQALKIAEGIHKVTQLPIERKILRRVQNNKSQTSKSVDERQEDVNKRFALCNSLPSSLVPKVIIVDDVITTGSTIHACYQWLTIAGYYDISVATLAVTI